jgi:hypothetical protein
MKSHQTHEHPWPASEKVMATDATILSMGFDIPSITYKPLRIRAVIIEIHDNGHSSVRQA